MRFPIATPLRRNALAGALAAAFLLCLASCGGEKASAPPPAPAIERGDRPGTDIVFGVSGPYRMNQDLMLEGIQMAVDEINAGEPPLGRKISIISKDDEGKPEVGKKIAQGFVDNPDLVAVIGHTYSSVTLPASVIYEDGGVLMITPGSTAPELTERNYRLIFRMIPSDREIGKKLAARAADEGWDRVAIYHATDPYGRGLAAMFEKAAIRLGLEIVDRRAYELDNAAGYRKDLGEWKEQDLDALLIAGLIDAIPEIVREAQGVGLEAALLGGDALDNPEFLAQAGDAAEGIILGSFFAFDPENPGPGAVEFTKAFQKKYGKLPTPWSAQGYDAVRLLVHAIEKAGSAKPADIAKALREMDTWTGVTGPHRFTDSGEIKEKPVVLKVVKNGAMELLED